MNRDRDRATFTAIILVAAIVVAIRIARAIAMADAASSAPPAGAEIHYAPAENLEPIDVGLIDEAGETIDMTAYVLTDIPVIEALRAAAHRGVKIRLYRSAAEHEADGEIAAAEAALRAEPDVEERTRRAPTYVHLKSYCVDGRSLRTGAANFSASGLKRQDNDLVILRGPGICAGFDRNFEILWNRGD